MRPLLEPLGRAARALPVRAAASLFVAAAASLAGPLEEEERELLARRADELAGELGFEGTLLVARGEEVLLRRAYGSYDRSSERPHTPASRFYVASLTKPVVALATLRLVDAGELSLEDVVAEHVEELAGSAAGRATLHQLLSHTAGLPHYESLPEIPRARRPYGKPELLRLLGSLEATGEPGERFHYSGPGYLVLGLVLERATGEPLARIVEEQVLGPLGMEDSVLLDGTNEPGEHARLYRRRGEEVEAVAPRHASVLAATGGLVSTVDDLHRFARAVQTGALLSPELHDVQLRAVQRTYACGLIVYRNPWLGGRYARHMGTMDGASAHLVFGLEQDVACVALSNLSPTAVDDLNDGLLLECVRASPARTEDD